MVVLLNLISALLVLSALFSLYKWVKTKERKHALYLAGYIAAIWLYTFLLPSYLPKGEIKRSAIPEFTQTTAEIENRARQPVPQEERRAQQEQQYREGPASLK